MPTPEQLLDFVQRTSGVGVCWLDARTRELHCQPEARRLLGFEAAGRTDWAELLERIEEPVRGRFAAAVQAALAGGGGFDLHAQVRAVGAAEARPLRLSGRSAPDAHGGVEAVLLAVQARAPVIAPVLEHAVAAAGIGLWELDLDSGLEQWSAQTLAMYGLPPDATPPTRQQWRERLLHPDDAQRQSDLAAEFFGRGNGHYEMDYRIRRIDGRVRWLHSRAAFLPGPGRTVIGLSMDITDRKEAELRAAEAWQLLDLSATQMGFGFGFRDRGFGSGHWSAQLKLIFGLPAAAPTPSRHELLQWIAPESREAVAANLQREAAVGELIEYRYDILRANDGARRTLLTRSLWLADGAGQPWRIAFATVDLTEQLAREHQMNEALQRLQLTTQALGIGTWERDIEAQRGVWDETTLALFGLPPEGPAPTLEEYEALIHPDDRAWMRRFHPSMRGEEPDLDVTFRVLPPDGRVRWLHVIGRGRRDASGRVVRRVGLCMDVTERRQAEEAMKAKEFAERANQAKTEFLSRMSHELRTPLNAVLGFAQLMSLDTTAPLPPAQQPRLEHILQAGWHLLALIDDVLDLSSIESREAALEMAWVPLAEVVAEVFTLNEPAAARERIGLGLHGAVGAQALWCDRRRLKQVLVNLVSNAVKYNRPGGSVEVGFEVSDGVHSVWVRDTGLGIEPARMGELFQPFNRLGRERSAIPGTGIGLTLSRQIAEMMQGRIEVRSEPGAGSEFRLVLPRPRHEVQSARPAQTA